MSDELLRAAVGLPVAALWPLSIPGVARRRFWRALAAALTALLVLGSAFPAWEAFALLALTAAAAALLAPPASTAVAATPPRPLVVIVLAVIGLAFAAGAIADADGAVEAVRDGVRDDRLIFVVVGLLAAVFAAGALIGIALGPLAARVRDEPPPAAAGGFDAAGLVRAGLYIGWLERCLVFVFVVAGEPGAAALALTAKSVARFPAFAAGREPLAEYVLIGTLASFTLVTAIAVGTRALLGLSAL